MSGEIGDLQREINSLLTSNLFLREEKQRIEEQAHAIRAKNTELEQENRELRLKIISLEDEIEG